MIYIHICSLLVFLRCGLLWMSSYRGLSVLAKMVSNIPVVGIIIIIIIIMDKALLGYLSWKP